jgi:hypothetical protein
MRFLMPFYVPVKITARAFEKVIYQAILFNALTFFSIAKMKIFDDPHSYLIDLLEIIQKNLLYFH